MPATRVTYLQGPAAAVGVFEMHAVTAARSRGAAQAVLKDVLRLLLLGGAKDREVAHVPGGRSESLRARDRDLLKVATLLLKEVLVKASDGARLLLAGSGLVPSKTSGHLASTSLRPPLSSTTLSAPFSNRRFAAGIAIRSSQSHSNMILCSAFMKSSISGDRGFTALDSKRAGYLLAVLM